MENLENMSKKNCGTFHGLFCITEMKSGAKTLLKTLQAISNTVSVKEEPMDEDDPDSANHSTTKSSTATSSAGKNDLITRFPYCFLSALGVRLNYMYTFTPNFLSFNIFDEIG